MKRFLLGTAVACAVSVAPLAAQAVTVYDNSATDLSTFIAYGVNGASPDQLGDFVLLAGSERRLTDASVQFYNAGLAGGTFDAALSFYAVGAGSSVGSQLGTYVRTGLTIGAQSPLTTLFSGLDLTVPDQVIFAVVVNNASTGLQLGLTVFDPPVVGSSDAGTLLYGPNLTAVGGGYGNPYFVANAAAAAAVPEPPVVGMAALGLLVVGAAVRRAQSSRNQAS